MGQGTSILLSDPPAAGAAKLSRYTASLYAKCGRATGTGELLAALAAAFPDRGFTAAEVVAEIDAAGSSGQGGAILEGLVRATGRPLKLVSSHAVGQRLKALKGRPALVGRRILALRHEAKEKGGEQGRWEVASVSAPAREQP
jgi:hypothetical protein